MARDEQPVRQVILGGRIIGAKIRAEGAREPAQKAIPAATAPKRKPDQSRKLRFPDSAESALFPPTCTGRSKLMSQTAYALLIFIGLTLTGYFGFAAWESSSEDRVTTGTIFHSR
jgi:hypothetical protein